MTDFGNYNFNMNFMPNYSAWQGIPYSLPNQDFNNIWNFPGMSTFSFNPMFTGGTSSSSSNKYLTTEEFNKQQAEAYNKFVQKRESDIKAKDEATTSLKEINDDIQQIENGKKSDGTVVIEETMESHKKQPWWKKALRAGGNMLQGAWKLCTNFVGYEDGKWNWKKCVKNVAIAAAVIGVSCIPVVGPMVSTTLLAVGAASGAYGVGKGIYKACKAETVEELDKAYQDIGSGATIGVTSALGLRGLGKGLQAGNTASTSTNTASTVTRSMGKNWFTQGCKDMTVNAIRATKQAVQADKAAVQSNGFLSTWGKNVMKLKPEVGEKKFKEAKLNTENAIDARLQEINETLTNNTSISSEARALLEQEQSILNAQKAQIANTQSQSGWHNMIKNSESHKGINELNKFASDLEANGSVNINGQTLSNSETNLKAIQDAAARVRELAKQVEKLSSTRTSTMKWRALRGKNKDVVQAFTGKDRATRIGRFWDIHTSKYAGQPWYGKAWTGIKGGAKLGWEAFCLPFKPWTYVDKTAAGSFYKIEQTFIPEYEMGLFNAFTGTQTITEKEAEQKLTQLKSQETALRQQLAQLA